MILLLLVPLVSSAGQCPVTEQSLLGDWERHSKFGFFDTMSFEQQGAQKVFNSWLHQNPEIVGGTWRLTNCRIFITHPTEKALTFQFTVLKALKSRVYLREAGVKEAAVYQRTQ